MYWTSDGKVLIEWSGCMGPTFRTEPYELDPLGEPILGKYLGSCEVWRSSGATAVSLGETEAEAFLDEDAPRGAVLSYWVMQKMEDGGERQIGPVIDVTLDPPALHTDATPPSQPNELRAKRKSGGNELSWLASCDDESGVLAYFVYSANEDQPDAVLWAPTMVAGLQGLEPDPEADNLSVGVLAPTATDKGRLKWLDVAADRNKPYIMRAIDNDLNLSDPTGRVDPDSGLPLATPGKVREPVEPIVPEGVTGWNYVPNPRFHLGMDGWTANGYPLTHIHRATSVPWGDLPAGADACARFDGDTLHYTTNPFQWFVAEMPACPGGTFDFTCVFGATADGDPWPQEARLFICAEAYDSAGQPLGGSYEEASGVLDEWTTHTTTFLMGTDAAICKLWLWAWPTTYCQVGNGWLYPGLAGYGYATLLRVGGNVYRDGDSAGWEWTGTAHDSASDGPE